MKTEQKNLTNYKSVISVVLEESDYVHEYQKSIIEQSKKINIKGFRKNNTKSNTGKIHIIKKLYGRSIFLDMIKDIGGKSLGNYTEKKGIYVLGTPKLAFTNLDQWSPQDFINPTRDISLDYEIYAPADFELPVFKDMKIEYLIPKEVSDDFLNLLVDRMSRAYGEFTSISISGKDSVLYGKIIDPGEGFELHSEIPIGYLRDEVKEKFIGITKGDEIEFDPMSSFKDTKWLVTLTPPLIEKCKTEKTILIFKVDDMADVKSRELNQEFFEEVFKGDGIQDEQQFKDKMKNQVLESKIPLSENILYSGIRKFLISHTDISLPEEVILKNIGLTKADLTNPDNLQILKNSQNDLKFDIIIDRISKDNNLLNLNTEDLLNLYVKIISDQLDLRDKNPKDILSMMAEYISKLDEKSRRKFMYRAKLEKIFRFIKDKITLEPREVNVSEIEYRYSKLLL